MIDPFTGIRHVYSTVVNKVRSPASDISRTPLGGGDSTDRPHNANLRKLNFTHTLYQLAYSLVLLQHLNTPWYSRSNIMGHQARSMMKTRQPEPIHTEMSTYIL